MKKISLLFLSLCSAIISAQFTSPGTGVTYNLASLSVAAPNDLVNFGTYYQMNTDITISAGDTLLMNEDTTLKINGGKQLTISGTYNTNAGNFLITAIDPLVVFKGIQFNAGSNITMRNTTLEYGGGIRVSTGNFLMSNCIVKYFKAGLVTGGAMSFSTGTPTVTDSQFIENDQPAFSAGANITVSARFLNNYLFKNSKNANKRPQINMGPGGIDSLKIIGNTIIGDRTMTVNGGISASALLGGVNRFQIENNTIKDNSFGITSSGATSTGIIQNNIIENNNTITDPMLGGSGISLTSTGVVVINGNQIRNNFWGITLLGSAKANIGDSQIPGNNIFKNNGNGGSVYALFNNTANPISAINNCWREGEISDYNMVESVISHQFDDAALGLVNFSPFLCGIALGTNNSEVSKNNIYPNPSNGTFNIIAENAGNITISDASGKLIYSGKFIKGNNTISVKAKSGVYFLVQQSEGKKSTSKLMIK